MSDLVVWARSLDALPRDGIPWMTRVRAQTAWLPRAYHGDRLYVVAEEALQGYTTIASLERCRFGDHPTAIVEILGNGSWQRCGLPCRIRQRKGFVYRWWDREAETQG